MRSESTFFKFLIGFVLIIFLSVILIAVSGSLIDDSEVLEVKESREECPSGQC